MVELSPELEERLQRIVADAERFIEDQLRQVDEGLLKESTVPASIALAARKAESAGAGHLYAGEVAEARVSFTSAAELYRRSAEAARERQPYANAYRKLPITLAKGLYAATIAGKGDLQTEFATDILALDPDDGTEQVNDDIVFHPDKYYLAVCLAQAVLDRIEDGSIERLEDENSRKSEPEPRYGQAILAVARGMTEDDEDRIRDGIDTALDYHRETLDTENPADNVFAQLATSLYLFARQQGYDVQIDSELIPNSLVHASLRELA